MLAMLLEHRCWIRRIACVAVFLLCTGALEASEHWHDSGCAEDLCAACLFSDSGSAAPGVSEQFGSRLLRVSAVAAPLPLVPDFRPFDPRRTRAPPVS